MNKTSSYLPWILRIVVALLFIVSAVSKMDPLWMFEKQLVDLGITNWCWSHYLARTLIALELAIGIALLQNNYIRSLVIPGTILLLVLFCVHLSIEMYKHGAMNGNCGCFGQLIPMTPLEAFIKNIVTIIMLIYLFVKVKDNEKGNNRIIYPLACFFGAMALLFALFPFTPCIGKEKTVIADNQPVIVDTLQQALTNANDVALPINVDTPVSNPKVVQKDSAVKKSTKNNIITETKTQQPTKPVQAVAAMRSKFAEFTQFGNTRVNLDEGKKIVCMFAPGCDHCQATARELGELAKSGNMPPVYILFMDEETFKIPEFFKISNTNYPYTVLDIPKFWGVMGDDATTPGVYYLQDGKIIKSYVGIDKDKFNKEEFKKILDK